MFLRGRQLLVIQFGQGGERLIQAWSPDVSYHADLMICIHP